MAGTKRDPFTGEELRLFHYTTGVSILNIVRSGEIELATDHTLPGIRPAVYCSLEAYWEPAANKLSVECTSMLIGAGIKPHVVMEHYHGGLFRVEVEPSAAPYTRKEYEATSGESREQIWAAYRVHKAIGSRLWMWRLSYESIPATSWVAIERLSVPGKFRAGEWVAFRPGIDPDPVPICGPMPLIPSALPTISDV